MNDLTYSAERGTVRIGDIEFPIRDLLFTSPPARVHPAVERPSRWTWEPIGIGMWFAAARDIMRPDPLTFIGAAANNPPA